MPGLVQGGTDAKGKGKQTGKSGNGNKKGFKSPAKAAPASHAESKQPQLSEEEAAALKAKNEAEQAERLAKQEVARKAAEEEAAKRAEAEKVAAAAANNKAEKLTEFMALSPAGIMEVKGSSDESLASFIGDIFLFSKESDKKVRAHTMKLMTSLAEDLEKGPLAAPALLVGTVGNVLALAGEKEKLVRDAAFKAVVALSQVIPAVAVSAVVPAIISGLDVERRWQHKVAALKFLLTIVERFPEEIDAEMPRVLVPALTEQLFDMMDDVVDAANDAITACCNVVDNRDVKPFLPSLISAMKNLDEIPECIARLASTTFVQTVEASALTIVVPLLIRGFREKKTSVKRECAVIIGNMAKLVEHPSEAKPFMLELLPAVERACSEIADPEARSVAERVHEQLKRIIAAANRVYAEPAGVREAVADALPGDSTPAREAVLDLCSTAITSLSNRSSYKNATWMKLLAPLGGDTETTTKALITKFAALTEDHAVAEEDEDDDDEELCNCKFTLAYGSKILLHNTNLRLKRGHRYGLLGGNDSGKTTLMRAIANGQVEGFPDASEVRTVFVDADVQGEMSHLVCLEYVFTDPAIQACGCTREQIADVMGSVGFTPKMLESGVSTLSGGWRMKLALARAMVQKADILLMDEPTAHLDVINLAWVESYILSLTNVTCVIVSHDAGFLDRVCQDILHIQDLKLNAYRGNLSSFVEKVPSAKEFFSLKRTENSVKFKFPQPAFLPGVKSKGRVLMKMDDVSFTYPSNDKPTLSNVSIRVSLSSRVACVGVNGAGKSTMIKLLTGELEACTGSVWQHDALTFAYMAQHSYAHIEKHLDMTANEYIRWRYDGGEDKEGLAKAALTFTPEEEAKAKKVFEYEYVDNAGKQKKDKRSILKLTGARELRSKMHVYEVQFADKPIESNVFMSKAKLEALGWGKIVKHTDIKADAAETQTARPLTQKAVEEHLEDLGLPAEFGTHHRMAALSGGQKVKVVLAAALWSRPHILILDEPTNHIDRASLNAMAEAIEEFEGGVVMITHNDEFCSALCPERWVLENGRLDCQGDAEWMKNAAKEAVEFKQMDELVDGHGNVTKVKKVKGKMSNKERKQRERRKKAALANGEHWSDSEDDDF